MIGDSGVGENALTRMKGIGAFASESFLRVAARTGRGGGPGKFQRGKIVDRSRPGKLKIFECGISAGRGGKLRPGHDEKNDVPESGGDYRSARDATFDPAISEKFSAEEFFGRARAGEQSADAASQTLVEATPMDGQLGRVADRRRGRSGGNELGLRPK